MEDSTYRIVTICPNGMSDGLQTFLVSHIDNASGSTLLMRDVLATTLLDPYKGTSLKFCGTFLGWMSGEYDSGQLAKLLSLLDKMTVSDSGNFISTEGFSHELETGCIQLVGAYPLDDLSGDMRDKEYINISLLRNRESTYQLFDWCYKVLLRGALRTDKLGIVLTILAESDELADAKIQEAIKLLDVANIALG